MLLIVNCKSIYGSDVPELSDALKRMGHEIVVFGGPGDQIAGDIERAKSILGAEHSKMASVNSVDSRRFAMLGQVDAAKAHFGETLVISDDPSDRAAADSLNIVTVSPFDFDLRWVGEEVNDS